MDKTDLTSAREMERVTLIQYVFSFGKHENKDVLQSSCFDCFLLDNAAIEEEKELVFYSFCPSSFPFPVFNQKDVRVTMYTDTICAIIFTLLNFLQKRYYFTLAVRCSSTFMRFKIIQIITCSDYTMLSY